MIRNAWLAVLRFLAFHVISLGVYRAWSMLYRAIWERRFRGVPIDPLPSLNHLARTLEQNADRWAADGPRQLFDAVSSPQLAQAVFRGEEWPDDGFDCDDFAIYIVHAFEAVGVLAMLPKWGLMCCGFFSSMWLKGWTPGGHNVALLTDGETFYYMDYGDPIGPFESMADTADAIRRAYADGADSLGYALQAADLTPFKVVHG